MRLLPLLVLAACAEDPSAAPGAAAEAPPLAEPALQDVTFAAAVETVAGSPLGLDRGAEGTVFDGSFGYDAAAPDLDDDDPRRGWYPHDEGGGFTLTVGDHVVTGSGRPEVEVLDHDPDRFAFSDGPDAADDDRWMQVDGEDRPDVVVTLAVTGTWNGWLGSDALPAPFQPVDTAVAESTFTLSDERGTLILRLTRLTPADAP